MMFFEVPIYVGGYIIGEPGRGLKIMLTKKPPWFHRAMVRYFFGFQWEDAPK